MTPQNTEKIDRSFAGPSCVMQYFISIHTLLILLQAHWDTRNSHEPLAYNACCFKSHTFADRSGRNNILKLELIMSIKSHTAVALLWISCFYLMMITDAPKCPCSNNYLRNTMKMLKSSLHCNFSENNQNSYSWSLSIPAVEQFNCKNNCMLLSHKSTICVRSS